MKHIFRFFGEPQNESIPNGDLKKKWVVAGEEHEHLRVLRLKSGDAVEVVDGKGLSAAGIIESTERHSTTISVDLVNSESAAQTKLAVALGALKPGDIDELIAPLVELGLDALHIFLQEGHEKHRLNDKAFERWQRLIRAATKQCKRSWMTEIYSHESIEKLVSALTESYKTRLLAEPDASVSLRSLEMPAEPGHHVCMVIGSEKGFNSSERQIFGENGFIPVRLPGSILRARTAAVAAAAMLSSMRS